MSYSFNVRAASKALAVAAAEAELDKVQAQQPIHARDREVANSTLAAMLALTAEPGAGRELSVSVSGSCYGPVGEPFEGISLNVNVSNLHKTS